MCQWCMILFSCQSWNYWIVTNRPVKLKWSGHTVAYHDTRGRSPGAGGRGTSIYSAIPATGSHYFISVCCLVDPGPGPWDSVTCHRVRYTHTILRWSLLGPFKLVVHVSRVCLSCEEVRKTQQGVKRIFAIIKNGWKIMRCSWFDDEFNNQRYMAQSMNL